MFVQVTRQDCAGLRIYDRDPGLVLMSIAAYEVFERVDRARLGCEDIADPGTYPAQEDLTGLSWLLQPGPEFLRGALGLPAEDTCWKNRAAGASVELWRYLFWPFQTFLVVLIAGCRK